MMKKLLFKNKYLHAILVATAVSSAAPGMLKNISYIQRVNTKNGLDFVNACTQAELGKKVIRPYQADYIFWRAV